MPKCDFNKVANHAWVFIFFLQKRLFPRNVRYDTETKKDFLSVGKYFYLL